jgi:hypothetical protein
MAEMATEVAQGLIRGTAAGIAKWKRTDRPGSFVASSVKGSVLLRTAGIIPILEIWEGDSLLEVFRVEHADVARKLVEAVVSALEERSVKAAEIVTSLSHP